MALKMILDSLDGVSEEIAAHYTKKGEKFELQAEGAKSQADIDRLQTALNSERATSKEWKTKAEAWGDRKPEEVIPMLDKYPELEAAAESGKKKLDQTQIDGIVNGRLAPLQRERDQFKKDADDRAAKIAEFEAKETKRTIFDTVRGLATETKAKPDSYGSEYGALMLLSKEIFTVDANGQVVVKEGVPGMTHGTLAKDAFAEIQSKHSYLWPDSVGGSSSGSNPSPGGQANPFKFNNLTDRATFAGQFPDKVDAMVKAAGLQNAWQLHPEKK